MVEQNFSIIDYIVLIIFLMTSALIGVFFAWKDRKKTSSDGFLTGGRKLQLFPVCMSLIASFLSTNTILGVPSEIYLYGTQYAVHLISFTIAVILAANVFMPVYYKLNLTSVHKIIYSSYDCLIKETIIKQHIYSTLFDRYFCPLKQYLLRRFGLNAVRISGSIGFILCTLPYLGVVLYGPALALASVTPLSISTSILVCGAICTFYTSIGGIKAVIWTDVLQTILMFSGLLMIAITGSITGGGLIAPWKAAYDYNRLIIFNPEFSLYRGDTFWAVFFGTLVGWTGTYCVKQTQVQRYCCMGTPSKAKKALYWNIPGVIIISFTAIWCGVVVFANYRDCDPVSLKLIAKHDQLLPYFAMQKLSSYKGLPGLFVCCVFSSSLSTLSSGFNALATVTWDDFIKRYYRDIKGKRQVLITKFIAMSYGLLAIAIAFIVGRLGTVLQASATLSGSITGPLLSLFCLGIFCPCINAIGAVTGLVSGISMCLFIAIGTIIIPRPKTFQLPVSVAGCSQETLNSVKYETYISAQNNKQYFVDYQPEGILKIIHINYMYIPVVGFITTLVVGIIVSFICKKCFANTRIVSDAIEKSDHTFVSPIVQNLCPGCLSTISDEKENIKRKKNDSKIFRAQPILIEVNDRKESGNIQINPLSEQKFVKHLETHL